MGFYFVLMIVLWLEVIGRMQGYEMVKRLQCLAYTSGKLPRGFLIKVQEV